MLATLSWIASYYLMPVMMGSGSGIMSSGVAGIVSSLSLSLLSFFEIVWVIGMAAMMFPAMIPIVLFYIKVATKQEPNPFLAKIVGTPLFLGGYLTTYAILGLGAFIAIYEALNVSLGLPQSLSILSVIAPSAVLIATGIYQFTPLKTRCLSHCVSPIGFFAIHYSNGLWGSMRMGFRHGIYCVGCCWAYMLVMLTVGAMSIPVMAVLAGVIAIEKVIVRGAAWFNRLVAGSFIALGVLTIMFPSILAIL
jgi:predicted metal-binding membrane protein